MTNVLVIGGANADIYGHVIAPQAVSGDSHPGFVSIHAGGVGRNIAENLGHLGADVSFISRLGDDAFADMLKTSLHHAGVASHLISQSINSASDTYLAILNAKGELISGVNSMALIDGVDADFLSQPDRQCALDHANMIILDGNLTDPALDMIFSQHGADKPIAVDAVSSIKVKRFIPYLEQITYIKCNQIEAAILTDIHNGDIHDMAIALTKLGIDTAIITHGARGFVIAHKQSCLHVPALKVEASNISGAGDALFASFLYAMAHKMDMQQAASLCQQAAALTLRHDGPVNPAMAELAKGITGIK
ncbi:MAG: hypothetical protein CBC12_03930 [Candidatus Puniceispirillum sp. TMED52]|nr:hypothetical protein [SAR116 cluster bacterium]OUU51889.1 MAG: hypothetical protein CBC12_03930 [Candidatus Puniceispirillum sp. TMED52]